MNCLPTSIAEHLKEAGFSGTEVLILRHLFEGQMYTIRELASKTGKSTGVLDQGVKKLIAKKIVKKEVVNASPKYLLDSVDCISMFLKKCNNEKLEFLRRREHDLDAFLHTVKTDATRPYIEYFEGKEGIEQAYGKILEYADPTEDILSFFPVLHTEHDDPMQEFRKKFSNDCRRKNIFCRTLVHNTLLGRRYHSRDAFMFRKTKFVSSDVCPIHFEQIIAGNTLTCIDYTENKANILYYPKLASTERAFFESIWSTAQSIMSKEVEQPPVKTTLLQALQKLFRYHSKFVYLVSILLSVLLVVQLGVVLV